MNPSLARPEPASLFKGTLSGRLQDMVLGPPSVVWSILSKIVLEKRFDNETIIRQMSLSFSLVDFKQGMVTNSKVNFTDENYEPTRPSMWSVAFVRRPEVSLIDHFIDEPRPLSLAVIGGGLAGILAGILLPAKVPGLMITIYEKNEDFGGTWLENIYPGIRCDTPSHAYQATFRHKVDWSETFPPGSEIRDYWQSLAREHDVHKFTKFKHKVEGAFWDRNKGKWNLTLLDINTNNSIAVEHDLVLTCIGRFNAWKLPHYEGIEDYKGLLRHTSNWDPSFDLTGKRVAVIGNGASGVQIVPRLQKLVKHLDHYARSPTWVGSTTERSVTQDGFADEQERQKPPHSASFVSYVAFRKGVEDAAWRGYRSFLRGSEENRRLREKFIGIMTSHFNSTKRGSLSNYIPDFSPNCRRQTPGPGYLESITADNVSFIPVPIKRFTATGIETQDGTHREVDAVFCATGAETAVAPQFSILANGQDLRNLWKRGGNPGFPYTYLGMATPGFPNLLFIHGPHGISPSGTIPHAFETQLTYVAKLLRKVGKEGIKSIAASTQAADDFIAYSDAFFKKTVLTDGCSSSYNGGQPGAKIHGFWPGSAAHLATVRREPRWEDWEYQYLSESGNRFLWYFGNGLTKKEGDLSADMTAYLQSAIVDLRDIHESWWRIP